MWRFFGKFGTVIGIFMAQNKAKYDKCFGFVHFKGVEDSTALEVKING